MAAANLQEVVVRLAKEYGEQKPPPLKDPFDFVIYENVSYLVTDEYRWKAFRNLKQTIGLRPEDILSASSDQFRSVVEMAGVDKKGRVGKLIRAAQIAMKEFGGKVSSVLELPQKKAVTALKKFPSIGEASAEKIMLFCGKGDELPLESNGLRVLVRIGFGAEEKNYNVMYRNARSAIADQVVRENTWLVSAYLLLRRHGQTICKTSAPFCSKCVVANVCAYGRRKLR